MFGYLTLPIILLTTQTTLHEGSHAIAGEILGFRTATFKPYPHTYNKHFYFGRTSTDLEEEIPQDSILSYAVAPAVTNAILFTSTDITLTYYRDKIPRRYRILILLFGMIAPYIDYSFNYVVGSDWKQIRDLKNGKAVAANIIGGGLLIFATYRLIKNIEREL